MMRERKCCGTCKHNIFASEGYTDETIDFNWTCSNPDSENYTYYTDYSEVCDDWEAKE